MSDPIRPNATLLRPMLAAALILGAGMWFATGRSPPAAQPRRTDAAAAARTAAGVEPAQLRVDYRRLDARITRLMHERDMVGLAVGTIEGGRIEFMRGYGEIAAGSGRPVTPDTVFRWASLSKGVAATLLAKLDESGTLALDTPVATLRTTLRLPGDWSRVTVADLLSHRLGLVRNAWDDRLEAGEDPRLLRARLATLAPYCPPATCYAYQNVAFDTASEIVEQATGQEYAGVVRRELFGPLGMTGASIGRAGLEGAASWARPHRRAAAPTAVNDDYYRVPAAGGVNSSIRDLLLWMRAQLGGAPRVVSPALRQALHRPRVPTPPHGRRGPMDRALTHAAYGLGWRSFDYAGHTLTGHRGSVDGYGALILFDEAERSGIVMLWNSGVSIPARLQLEFFDMLLGLPPTDWLDLKAVPGDIAAAEERRRHAAAD